MIVGLDIGLKRIGVAVCVNGVILPSTPLMRQNRKQAARDLDVMLKEKNASKVIVGIPKDGSCQDEMTRRIKHFMNLLGTKIEIIFVDESFSSVQASHKTQEKAIKSHKNGHLDSLAACEILRRYVEGKNGL